MKRLVFSAAVTLALCANADAQEWILGLGGEEVLTAGRSVAPAIVAEYHLPAHDVLLGADLSWGFAAQADSDGDVWVGFGLTGKREIGEKFFLETSFMPGYYHQAPGGTVLGYGLEFRSLIGVGYQIGERTGLSLAFDHKSNGGLSPVNPGTETISLRYHRSF